MAPTRNARKKWEFKKGQKHWVKPKYVQDGAIEDTAFKLTEVDPNGDPVELPAQLAKRKRAEQDALDAEEWEENMNLLTANSE